MLLFYLGQMLLVIGCATIATHLLLGGPISWPAVAILGPASVMAIAIAFRLLALERVDLLEQSVRVCAFVALIVGASILRARPALAYTTFEWGLLMASGGVLAWGVWFLGDDRMTARRKRRAG